MGSEVAPDAADPSFRFDHGRDHFERNRGDKSVRSSCPHAPPHLKPVLHMSSRATQSKDRRQFVSFVVGEEEFGVEILTVQEIIRPIDITRVPHAPAFVEGVVNLRGRILPVINLRTRFGFPERTQDDDTRIVVVDIDDQVVGFLTDAVREVLRIDDSTIEPAPDLAVGIDAHYLRGVAKLDDRLLILLDLATMLSHDEVSALNRLRDDEDDNVSSSSTAPASVPA